MTTIKETQIRVVKKVIIRSNQQMKNNLLMQKKTLESAFFPLPSAIKTGKFTTLDEENTGLDMGSDIKIELVRRTSGVVLVIEVIILLYRARNRFNRIVHRTIPKSKFHFPPPLYGNPNAQYLFHVTAAQALSTQTQQQHQSIAFAPPPMTTGTNNFQNLHKSLQGMYKPNKENLPAAHFPSIAGVGRRRRKIMPVSQHYFNCASPTESYNYHTKRLK